MVLPVATQFDADLLLINSRIGPSVSSGEHISSSAFARIIKILTSLADGRVILNISISRTVSECTRDCAAVLFGRSTPNEPDNVFKKALNHREKSGIDRVKEQLRRSWTMLDTLVSEEEHLEECLKIPLGNSRNRAHPSYSPNKTA